MRERGDAALANMDLAVSRLGLPVEARRIGMSYRNERHANNPGTAMSPRPADNGDLRSGLDTRDCQPQIQADDRPSSYRLHASGSVWTCSQAGRTQQ